LVGEAGIAHTKNGRRRCQAQYFVTVHGNVEKRCPGEIALTNVDRVERNLETFVFHGADVSPDGCPARGAGHRRIEQHVGGLPVIDVGFNSNPVV
jgi:hypothetical protein